MNVLESTLQHEGFRDKPYQDHLGNWTFGHGLTWISEEESEIIVKGRLESIGEEILSIHTWFPNDSPKSAKVFEVVTEMAYQMGMTGLNNFKNMWIALEAKDYTKAADEMLDSKWAKQTPERANQMANIIRALS